MKKYFSNLLTILISVALISSTIIVTAFGSADEKSITVEEQIIAKGGAQKLNEEFPGSQINVNKMFDKFTGNGHKDKVVKDEKGNVSPASTKSSSATAGSSTSFVSDPAGNSTPAKATTTVKIPYDESNNIEDIKNPNYESPYYIVVYTESMSAVVYGKNDTGAYNMKIKAFTVATGSKKTPTRKGVYKIRAKYRWRRLNGDCWGQWCSSISPDYLFHSVPYAKRSVNSLYNGSYNNLGRVNSSHGCIRMCVRDVKWIYDNCPIGTQVNVVWKSGPKGAGVPKRKSGSKYSGWDPSDQWASGNPYFKNVSTTESNANTTGERMTTTISSNDETANSTKATQSTKAEKNTTKSTQSTKKTTASRSSSKSQTVKSTANSTSKSKAKTSKETVKTNSDEPSQSKPEEIAVG